MAMSTKFMAGPSNIPFTLIPAYIINSQHNEGILTPPKNIYRGEDCENSPDNNRRDVCYTGDIYRRQLERPWSQYRWEGHGWNWTLNKAAGSTWSFVVLTSGEQLFREGQAMHHCVSSYAALCASGHSAIVSVTHNDIRRVTVEINPRTKQVVQANGLCNRPATPEERGVISHWLGTVVRRTPPA